MDLEFQKEDWKGFRSLVKDVWAMGLEVEMGRWERRGSLELLTVSDISLQIKGIMKIVLADNGVMGRLQLLGDGERRYSGYLGLLHKLSS